MPQSLNIARYPSNFLLIAQKLETQTETLRIPVPDSKAAHRLRFQLNGFRRALGTDAELSRTLSVFMSATFRLREESGTNFVIIEPADNSDISRAIETALGQSPTHVLADEFQVDALKAPAQSAPAQSTESLLNSHFFAKDQK